MSLQLQHARGKAPRSHHAGGEESKRKRQQLGFGKIRLGNAVRMKQAERQSAQMLRFQPKPDPDRGHPGPGFMTGATSGFTHPSAVRAQHPPSVGQLALKNDHPLALGMLQPVLSDGVTSVTPADRPCPPIPARCLAGITSERSLGRAKDVCYWVPSPAASST